MIAPLKGADIVVIALPRGNLLIIFGDGNVPELNLWLAIIGKVECLITLLLCLVLSQLNQI